MLSPNWISLIILLAIIAIVWFFDRKNFKREGIMFLRRTEKGLQFIDKFAKKHAQSLRIFGTLGIIFSFGALGAAYVRRENKKNSLAAFAAAFSFIFLLLFSINMNALPAAFSSLFGASGLMTLELIMGVVNTFSLGPNAPPVVQPVLPIQGKGIYYVPIDFWLISIFTILIVHEFSHAFVSRAEKISVKSLGYGFLAVIPLGFAEPDERELKKASSIKRSRIFAAGSFSNVIAAIISIVLLTITAFTVSALYTSSGVKYETVVAGTPADISLPHSGIITEVNGIKITNTFELSAAMDAVKPGNEMSLVVDNKAYAIVAASDPKNSTRAFIGISGISSEFAPKEKYAGIAGSGLETILFYLASLFRWLFMLNLGIGLFNLLPLKPFDGGLIFEEILKEFLPKIWKSVYSAVSTIVIGVLGILFMMLFFGSYIVNLF